MQGFLDPGISFGQKIKQLRTMRKIKQFELASGICSVSYLSKVESDSIIPSEEIKDLLLAKLNIHTDVVGFDQKFYQELNQWKLHLTNFEKEEADNLFKELSSMTGPFIKNELLLKFKIFTIKYYQLKGDFIKAAKLINEMKPLEPDLSLENKYYFQRYVGEHHYYQLQFKDALEYLLECEKILPLQLIENGDRAQLYYSIALSANKTDKFHISITYSKKALELYQSLYSLERCTDCHIILGIAFKRIANFEESLVQYKTAITLATSINCKKNIYICNHNLGQLYSFMGEINEAFKYYYICYESSDDISSEFKIETIISIIQDLYKIGENSKLRVWIDRGRKFCESNIGNEKKSFFMKVFHFYEDLYNKNFESLQKILDDTIISYFEENQKLLDLSEILRSAADYEYSNSRYKLAALFYKMSRDYLKKSLKLK
jgi:HTH-type transcriptional regulator, quorum sensing regulator NprR